ncbi:alpha/beta fold hydrolase [Fimbriimonas ginsengisoli]|uniref:prolyl aminopeptidase n=1 Tax=Fimbriimonas ginsengisoli Gsoil 348 TaxID=661478 RepID=A0A068NUJ4_FIMGI|nr:alpha/beta hydrolase [Fimbriimonas ginsengisoli]AIE85289.1 proline imino-peptidase [Fimbriimonas ginsengisoli Gsoil 348]
MARVLEIRSDAGIDEGRFVRIGGIDQWIQVRGEDRGNPVLLVLHGGPGVSYVPFASAFRSWEKDFTVVHWDQRGAGKTFGRNGKSGSGEMSIDRMVEDGVEVAEWVCRHLKQSKVVLFCHSWGTILGLPMVQRRPDLFHAYVGTGQVVAMAKSEPISYDLLLEQAREGCNDKAVRALEQLGRPPYPNMRTWMMKQRLIMLTSPPPKSGKLPDIFTSAVFTPGYPLRDAYHWMVAFNFSLSHLYESFMSYDAAELPPTFQTPILIFQGADDIQAPTATVEEYFATIEAPQKLLVKFPEEGHTAVLSNPDLFLQELRRHVCPLISASVSFS